jgi:ribosomal protein L11 methyltransferase
MEASLRSHPEEASKMAFRLSFLHGAVASGVYIRGWNQGQRTQNDGQRTKILMYQWTKQIDPSQRESWEQKLETDSVPGLFLEEDVASGGLRVAAICALPEEAADLVTRFGGHSAPLENRDWVAVASESWKGRSLEIGKRFLVALDDDSSFLGDLRSRFPGRELLVFPPEQAFGTGDHETTSACLEGVEEFAAERCGGEWSLLDLGTGTGILAIAGFKAGATRIVATEVDATALKVAEGNLARNGVPEGGVDLRLEDVLHWNPGERFDLICANLYAGLLLRVVPILPEALRFGGRVLLSGMLQEQEPEVREALHATGFEVSRKTIRGKWATLAACLREP